jgi:hypothetical protein
VIAGLLSLAVVPADYDQFFVATTSVAGALIGLLFVAVSVRPAAAARTAHITTRLRAVSALSAFLNTLFLSLFALRPRPGFGQACTALGAVGLLAMLVLLLLLVAQGRDRPWPLVRGVTLVLGQGVLYLLQFLDGLRLAAMPTDAERVDELAIIVIVLFALGVARAWEFVGADNPSLLGAIARVAGVSAPGHSPQDEPDPEGGRAPGPPTRSEDSTPS